MEDQPQTNAEETPTEDDSPLTEEEIRELLKPHPMSPKDVIAAGLTGTMQHLPDGLTWVLERKKEREERLKRKNLRD